MVVHSSDHPPSETCTGKSNFSIIFQCSFSFRRSLSINPDTSWDKSVLPADDIIANEYVGRVQFLVGLMTTTILVFLETKR